MCLPLCDLTEEPEAGQGRLTARKNGGEGSLLGQRRAPGRRKMGRGGRGVAAGELLDGEDVRWRRGSAFRSHCPRPWRRVQSREEGDGRRRRSRRKEEGAAAARGNTRGGEREREARYRRGSRREREEGHPCALPWEEKKVEEGEDAG